MDFVALLNIIHRYCSVTDDTRDLLPGGVFVYGAGRGNKHAYLEEALRIGAQLIVSEDDLPCVPPEKLIKVADRRIASALLACEFYRHPSHHLKMVGVTGTCGKTTTTYLLENILDAASYDVGVIGTENIRHHGTLIPSPNTTPSAFVLNRTLREMLDAGCTAVAMEVSSHAIEHERIRGIAFDGVIFTNLSVEHLDLHGTMSGYFQSKSRLFTEHVISASQIGKACAIAINVDDPYGQRLYEQITDSVGANSSSIIRFGCSATDVELIVPTLTITPSGTTGVAYYNNGQLITPITINSPLIGQFNAENILGTLAIGLALNIDIAAIEKGIARNNQVPGRMQRLLTSATTSIVVDYAHKPGALKVVLTTLRNITQGRLICVVGCGGQRDRAKRPLMAAVSSTLSDLTFIAPDNLRGEDAETIAQDMIAGIPEERLATVRVIHDRRSAIAEAIKSSHAEDTILIAGRGAEQWLSINDEHGNEAMIAFDDRVVAGELIIAQR